MTPRHWACGIIAVLPAAALCLAVPVRAQSSPSISLDRNLGFGTIIVGTTPGDVTVDPSGLTSCTGGVACAGGGHSGAFSLSGTPEMVVTVSMGSTTLDNGQGSTMALTLVPSANTITIEPAPARTVFTVGGTLSVGANQADGIYSGSYEAIVEYQ